MNMIASASEVTQPSADELDREARKIVSEIGIPPCPAILTKLLREMREDDPDFQGIGTMLSSDIGLAAAMLKTVNSPFYGLGRKATSIQQALMLLGLQNVARLVTGLLLRQAFAVSNNDAMEGFWTNAANIAAGTAHLARTLRCAERDEAYTFGLFRDCGMPLLACKYADYAALLHGESLKHGRALLEAEEERYGVTHALVGYHMATSWFLSADLCLAIQQHHDVRLLENDDLTGKAGTLIALGMLAEHIVLISQDAVGGAHGNWDEVGPAVLRRLEISEADIAGLADEFPEMQA
jgi:HD-like signal output (HDOD) protein